MGSMLLNTPLGFASERDISTVVEVIVYRYFPELTQYPESVEKFVYAFVNRKISLMEDWNFIKTESRKQNMEKFERFVVVQFVLAS